MRLPQLLGEKIDLQQWGETQKCSLFLGEGLQAQGSLTQQLLGMTKACPKSAQNNKSVLLLMHAQSCLRNVCPLTSHTIAKPLVCLRLQPMSIALSPNCTICKVLLNR